MNAQGRLKMRDRKMWHKNAGHENAGLENTAQEILGWKMREKSVGYGKRTDALYSIKWTIVYWHNKNKHVVHFSNNCLTSVKIGLKHYTHATPILFIDRPK